MSAPAVVIPSLGGAGLATCLDAIAGQELAPSQTVVVLSGPGADIGVPGWVSAVRSARRLGFSAAIDAGLEALPGPPVDAAILNDDAVPGPTWLAGLAGALAEDPSLAAVQGTVLDATGERVDGRGITLDRYGLPVQVDRGRPAGPEPSEAAARIAVSGTAALLRGDALDAVRLGNGAVFDPSFGSYYEDLDLGLRLGRFGWRCSWIPGAPVRHVGSATGRRLRWRHPWWLLANRWRALAGNLTAGALVAALPRLARGELRAVRTLGRANARTWAVAPAAWLAVPLVIARGLARRSPGPRLTAVPRGTP